MWKLENNPDHSMGSKKKSEGNARKYLETNRNGYTTYKNLWDATKAILRVKYIVLNSHI